MLKDVYKDQIATKPDLFVPRAGHAVVHFLDRVIGKLADLSSNHTTLKQSQRCQMMWHDY